MSRAAGRLGWFLLWAVVFCDIGTSVYYAPGILYDATGDRAGFFVLAAMVGFLLMAIKEVEVTRRFSSGGGVVSLADAAFGPWWACAGGQLIMVDFFLTVAISAAAGVYYVDSLVPLGAAVVPVTLVCLGLLGALNVIGIKESARVSTVLAVSALGVNLLVAAAVLVRVPSDVFAGIASELGGLGTLTPWEGLVGFAGAWLAFSGLESMSQVAPAMRDLGRTPRLGMLAIVASVAVTTPVLTLLATFALPPEVKDAGGEALVAYLGGAWGGPGLKLAVVTSATLLLLFAANTALLGNYHVQMALTRRRFLPEGLSRLGDRYQTPQGAILLSTLVPAAILVAVWGDMRLLGELYAFGLLGALALTSVGVDVLRWRDRDRGAMFFLGLVTSALVLVAFVTLLVARPWAALFGGGLAAVGMVIGLATRADWWGRIVARIPRLAPPREVERADMPFHTVEQAAAFPRHELPGILVASRGASRKLFREAVDRARARGQERVFLLYVDEIPGLFYPQLAAPTQEGLTVLEAGAEIITEFGLEPVRVWGLSHSAAATVAEAAEAIGCDTVVIGATQRTFLWQALRGKFIQDLLRQLPGTIRLVVVG